MRGQDPKLGHAATAARGDGRPSRKPREGRQEAVVTRRECLDVALATTFVAGVGHSSWAVETKGGIPCRTLGRTGEQVSMVGLGGYHLGQQADEQESLRIIRTAIDNGVNFGATTCTSPGITLSVTSGTPEGGASAEPTCMRVATAACTVGTARATGRNTPGAGAGPACAGLRPSTNSGIRPES